MYNLETELLQVIQANAAPNRPEHYLKPSGLRKYYAARGSREYGVGSRDAAQLVQEYSRGDFSDATAWRLRGKLNIPRERFIYYGEFDHTGRGVDAPDSGGPWFGWAGWDEAQRADALAFLLDRANRAGWELHYRQCGLRAALRDLLPSLAGPAPGSEKVMPAADRAEFEALAGACGISLDSGCYCPAYRDGITQDQPGAPGVTAEALGVKILPAESKKPAGKGRKKSGGAEQLELEL